MRKEFCIFYVILFLFVFSINAKSQENYIVTGSNINIREGAGSNFNSIGKLNKGDEVLVYEINGDWAKIFISNKEVYINKNYIQIKNKYESKQPKQKDIFDNIWFFIFCAIVLVLWVIIIRFNKKCNSCKKWNAMKKFDTKIVDKIQSTIKKSETLTDVKGNKHTNNYYVPATITTYHIHRKCYHCGYTDTLKKSVKEEN